MVANTEVRKIPYTVQRPVTETKTRRVPIQQQRWMSEEHVRKGSGANDSNGIRDSPRADPSSVLRTGRGKANGDATGDSTGLRALHRNRDGTSTNGSTDGFVLRRSFQPGDRFGLFIVPRSFQFPRPFRFIDELWVTESVPAPENLENEVIERPALDEEPQTRLQKVEIGDPEPESASDASGAASETDADDDGGAIEEELTPPAQQRSQPETDEGETGGADAKEAGWRIRWNPVYAPRRV